MNQPNWTPVRPTRTTRQFWTQGPGIAIIAIVATIVCLMALYLKPDGKDPMAGFDATVTGCKLDNSPTGTIATVDYTVKNKRTQSRIAVVTIEYRDDQGDLVDRDTSETRWIGGGDTVHGTEMTSLDVPIKTGTCHIVSAS